MSKNRKLQIKRSPEMDDTMRSLFPDQMNDVDRSICPGCQQPVIPLRSMFKDWMSWKEFHISGMCQKCQDKLFAEPDDEDDGDVEV